MNFPLSRPQPLMGVGAYRTYEMRAPLGTHFRPATCPEVQCLHYLRGWRVHLEALTPDLVEAARTSGRRYREETVGEGQTYLVFEPGQLCFRVSEHRARLDRAPLFVVRDGDYRGNPTGRGRQHTRSEDWVEDFAAHQQAIADEIEKG
jgi:hypothetical protein